MVEHKAKLADWTYVVERQSHFQISPKDQRLSDSLYMQLLGPVGFVDPYTKPFQHSGTMTIGLMQVWWCTDIAKYTLFGLVPQDVYEVVVELGDILKTLCQPVVDLDDLSRLKIRFVEIMCHYESVIPLTC